MNQKQDNQKEYQSVILTALLHDIKIIDEYNLNNLRGE